MMESYGAGRKNNIEKETIQRNGTQQKQSY